MQHVLVTGGAGYIGSVLCPMLLDAGFRVTVLDRLLFRVDGTAFLIHPNFRFIQANIWDVALVEMLMKEVDYVVHLAAIVGEPACNRWPELAEKTNKTGSETLISLSENCNVKRFVFSSTCSNYGIMAGHDLLDEDSPLQPVSAYARHKVEIEKRLLTSKIAVPCVLRFATAFGLSPRMRFDLTVNHFTKDACTGKKTDVYGGAFWRPYAHIHDISRSILMALQLPEQQVSRSVMNVGSTTENFTKEMLTQTIREEVPSYQFEIHPVTGTDPRNYRVNFKRISEKWGFRIEKPVREGIREISAAFQAGRFTDADRSCYANHLEIDL